MSTLHLRRRPREGAPQTRRRAPRALAVVAVASVAAGSLVGSIAGSSAAASPAVARSAASGEGSTTTSTRPPATTTTTTTTTSTLPNTLPTTVPPTTPPTTPGATVPPTPTVPTTTVPTPTVPTTAPRTASTTTTTTTATTTTLPPAPAPQHVIVYPEQIAHILATIRYMESRGIYTLPPNKGNASGAYQFIARTWQNYGGYAHAYLAPPHIQDERAALDVQQFLDQWDNDVSMIPVMWYLPAASRNPALMDVVPLPEAGNKLTIREYQTRWLGVFAFISGQPLEPLLTGEQARARTGAPPEVPEPVADEVALAFPVLGPSRLAAPDCDSADVLDDVTGDGPSRAEIEAAGLCTEQAPGIVFGVKLQPVVAVADGVVTAVHDRPGEPITVTVTDAAGRSYTYSGFNDDNPGTDDGAAPPHLRLTAHAKVGVTVWAGQVLGFMGDSDPLPLGVRADVPTDATVQLADDAVAPHIRLTITALDGSPIDAYGPLIDAAFRQACSVAIGPWSVIPNGSGHRPVTIETTDNDRNIDSEWVITSTGQVTATGWAAMVFPHEGCGWAPATAHGPGGDGQESIPRDWFFPIDLPTSTWVELALRDGPTTMPVWRR